MLRRISAARTRWIPLAFLLAISCAGAAQVPQEAAGPDAQDWPKSFDARESRIVVYEPQLESFKGSRLLMRSAVSLTRGDAEPVFGAVWLDAVVTIDAGRKIVTPVVTKVGDVRFPNLGSDEAARLRQDIGDEIPRWNLAYPLDDLQAEIKLVEERKALAQNLKAEVPKILFRTTPAVLISIQDEPAWRPVEDSPIQRLENCSAFVVRDPSTGVCYLRLESFWWMATDPLGAWQPVNDVPGGIAAAWANEPKPQSPATDPGQDAAARPEVIAVNSPTELISTDGEPQYAPISGTDLLYVKNTESDVFLETRTQVTYALFSGRWYRTADKNTWTFVVSDQLPDDFRRIPPASEKHHVLACVSGTPQAREAVKNSEIPQTEAVKPGPAPDLQATYDGSPQFTDVEETPVQYAVNTPYSIFCVDRRYYWCLDGIWYDSLFATGPWFVCTRVPRPIYLIPPSCPHYYVTYCHVFSVTPSAIYVGYYPGYRGCYVWNRTVVFGTGWHYRPWYGTRCYSRPVTWGVGVRYSPSYCGWSVRSGSYSGYYGTVRRQPTAYPPAVQAGVGGWWGGSTVRATGGQQVRSMPASAPNQNLYTHQTVRLAPRSAALPQGRPEPPAAHRAPEGRDRDHDGPRAPREGLKAPSVDRDEPKSPPPVRKPFDNPKNPPPAERDTPRTPPPPTREPRETPKGPPPDREEPRTPPPRRTFDDPRTPPPAERETPKTPPPAPREVPREAPRRTPPQEREAPKAPPPPPPPPPREAPRNPPPPPPREAPKSPPPPRREAPKQQDRQQQDKRRQSPADRENSWRDRR